MHLEAIRVRGLMSHEIRVVECARSSAEQDLNAVSSQGWQLVSCWAENETLVGVFQRALAREAQVRQYAPPQERPSAGSGQEVVLGDLTLVDVLGACLAKPPSKPDFPYGVSVSALAKSHGVEAEDMLGTLRGLGLKSKDDDPKRYSMTFDGHSLWLNQATNGGWFVNAKAFKKS